MMLIRKNVILSDCLGGQAGCHGLRSRRMALRMTRSLRMQAVMACLWVLPGGPELGVIRGDDRVMPAGDHGGHEEGGADRGAAAGDGAAASQGAAVAVDRGEAG